TVSETNASRLSERSPGKVRRILAAGDTISVFRSVFLCQDSVSVANDLGTLPCLFVDGNTFATNVRAHRSPVVFPFTQICAIVWCACSGSRHGLPEQCDDSFDHQSVQGDIIDTSEAGTPFGPFSLKNLEGTVAMVINLLEAKVAAVDQGFENKDVSVEILFPVSGGTKQSPERNVPPMNTFCCRPTFTCPGSFSLCLPSTVRLIYR
ncbi:hypothetical protein BaRGS_00034537, partial [Batillaria attramentaria]